MELLEPVSTGLGTVRWTGRIPNDPNLLDRRFWNQCLLVDPGVNDLGVVASNSGTATIGG